MLVVVMVLGVGTNDVNFFVIIVTVVVVAGVIISVDVA